MPVAQRYQIRSKARLTLLNQMKGAQRELMREVRAHADEVKKEFEDVVSDWSSENRSGFKATVKIDGATIVAEVRPKGRGKPAKIFHWVDQGTRPYIIRPRRRNKRGLLIFRLGYSARTQPVARAHVGTGKATGPWVFTRLVHHPGIRARRFSETVQKGAYKRFRQRIDKVFKRLARRQQKG